MNTGNIENMYLCPKSKKMNNLRVIIAAILVFAVSVVYAQQAKRAMTFDDLAGWKRISEQVISDDGKWVACKMEPWRGDAVVYLYDREGKEIASFQSAEKVSFSASCAYLLATIKPELEEVEKLKLKKTKKEEMPADRLLIYQLQDRKEERIDSIKTHLLSEKADFIAYQRVSKKDSSLYVRSLDGGVENAFPAVSDFKFAKEGDKLYYVSKGDSLDIKAGLYTYLPQDGKSHLIYEGEGVFKQVTFDKKGDKLAFLYCPEKDSVSSGFALFVSQNNAPAEQVADKAEASFPDNWVISEHGAISFSDNASRLFFGTAPEPKKKDTTILDENRPKVQIWNWDEKVQYTQQTYNKERDLKKTYRTAYSFKDKKVIRLASPELPDLLTAGEGNSRIGILSTSEPYGLEQMWLGKSRHDVYSVDLESGETALIKKELEGQIRFSPQGNYAYWYCWRDSSWYTWSVANGKEYRLTIPATFTAWDEENDVPDYPSSHGIAGWTKGDKQILIYDRYDIWQFDPENNRKAVNLTASGRKDKISYRYIQTDKEEKQIKTDAPSLLTGFNEQTKATGYYSTKLNISSTPKALLSGDFMVKTPVKSKKSDALIYTKETFEQYPDIYLSDLTFKNAVKLTDGGGRQDSLLWGTAELISWTSLDGKKLEGVVYKPENFDPKKKYPLLVNFYERNSETLYSYRMPEPHRSTIDYHFYNSQGYIIFNPDVVYETGYPGESCFNCVMPGISTLMEEGYIDEKAIAAQGHSWGGYQVAYLATRTRLFAAIESGAPVVNMLSAYGGIRWGSGLNRSFQYEHTQSRIGASIWESPLRYQENSPLFTMDKVETPILIMHNDNDGHVPWYQEIGRASYRERV